MTMNDRTERTDLTPDEAAIVGSPGDLITEAVVPPRRRTESVMLSLRVDRKVVEALGRLAEADGRTLSETARAALLDYVLDHAGSYRYPERSHASSSSTPRVSENTQIAWDDADLQAELQGYEAACRRAQMREKAWRSYVDYARRFLHWRIGDYSPRGVPADDRPTDRAAASTSVLREQAKEYARQVEAAGREQSTVDTYYRHAMFFIRWLEGDFEPGARLRGLR
jgi:hypothetical protein